MQTLPVCCFPIMTRIVLQNDYSQFDVSSSVTVSARVVERLCAPCCSMVPNISPSICRNEWTLRIIAIQIHRAYYCIHKQHCQTNATHLLPRDWQCFLIPLRVLIKEPFMFFFWLHPVFSSSQNTIMFGVIGFYSVIFACIRYELSYSSVMPSWSS
jgi:hypothetical protein